MWLQIACCSSAVQQWCLFFGLLFCLFSSDADDAQRESVFSGYSSCCAWTLVEVMAFILISFFFILVFTIKRKLYQQWVAFLPRFVRLMFYDLKLCKCRGAQSLTSLQRFQFSQLCLVKKLLKKYECWILETWFCVFTRHVSLSLCVKVRVFSRLTHIGHPGASRCMGSAVACHFGGNCDCCLSGSRPVRICSLTGKVEP